MRKIALTAVFFLIIILSSISYAQTPNCQSGQPRCYYDQVPRAGHGPASNLPTNLCSNCAGDNRRVITIRIDSSWGAPTTNANIWNAVQCAANLWNDARDGTNTTGYYFVLDQGGTVGSADLTVTNDSTLPGFAATNSQINASDPNRQNLIKLNPANGNLGNGAFQAEDLCGRIAHEMGHNIGIRNLTANCNSIMTGVNTDGNRPVNSVSANDVQGVNRNFAGQGCDETVASGNECGEQGISPGLGYVWNSESCQWELNSEGSGCDPEEREECFMNWTWNWDENTCTCYCDSTLGCYTPILIDVSGNGFDLTDALNGVDFDMPGNGLLSRMSWTAANSDDAWLVLDRNGNGRVDNGTELFGNATSQPAAPAGVQKNGFRALAEYDKSQYGGNQDAVIDQADTIFSALRLWQDSNHNGVSELSELHTLTALGLNVFDLDYKKSKKTDQYGNQFRYRAKVKATHSSQASRWAWDVFLVR
jgi:hypothetical protein